MTLSANFNGIVQSIQIGKPKTSYGETGDHSPAKSWTSGIFKEPVPGPLTLTSLNLEGDGQADLSVHGGADKAICSYPVEHLRYWNETIPANFPSGAFGENFSTHGLLENDIYIGDIYSVGSALVQVSQPRQPCWKIARRWDLKQLPLWVQETGKTGWYFRVLQEGVVTAGDSLDLQDRLQAVWSISSANQILFHDKANTQGAAQLYDCPGLSDSWKKPLLKRFQ